MAEGHNNKNNKKYDRSTEENIRQRISLATGRISEEASRTMAETANDIRRDLQNVEKSENQIRYDSRGLSEREIIIEQLEKIAKENGLWIENYGWTNGKYSLRDANTRNVAVDSNGIFYFFDLIPKIINTKRIFFLYFFVITDINFIFFKFINTIY